MKELVVALVLLGGVLVYVHRREQIEAYILKIEAYANREL